MEDVKRLLLWLGEKRVIEGVEDLIKWTGTKNVLFFKFKALEQRSSLSFSWKRNWKNCVQPKFYFFYLGG